MSTLDIIILIPLLWAAFKGFKNGLVKEVFSLIALILGIYITYSFSDYVAMKLPNLPAIGIIAFIITFVSVVIAIHFVGILFEKIVKIMVPNFVNRLAGICFGVIKVLFICSILLHFTKSIDKQEIILKSDFIGNSLLYPYVEKSTTFIIDFADTHFWK